MNIGGSISGAIFCDDNRRFRYALWRIWQPSGDKLLFIGLNPSTGNDIKDDPTIRRMVGFAKSWGFGGLFVGNLFSFVSSDPARLFFEMAREHTNGPADIALRRMRELCTLVVVGWGEVGKRCGSRPAEVLALIEKPVHCIKANRSGEPSHPLYLRSSSQLIPYVREGQK